MYFLASTLLAIFILVIALFVINIETIDAEEYWDTYPITHDELLSISYEFDNLENLNYSDLTYDLNDRRIPLLENLLNEHYETKIELEIFSKSYELFIVPLSDILGPLIIIPFEKYFPEYENSVALRENELNLPSLDESTVSSSLLDSINILNSKEIEDSKKPLGSLYKFDATYINSEMLDHELIMELTNDNQVLSFQENFQIKYLHFEMTEVLISHKKKGGLNQQLTQDVGYNNELFLYLTQFYELQADAISQKKLVAYYPLLPIIFLQSLVYSSYFNTNLKSVGLLKFTEDEDFIGPINIMQYFIFHIPYMVVTINSMLNFDPIILISTLAVFISAIMQHVGKIEINSQNLLVIFLFLIFSSFLAGGVILEGIKVTNLRRSFLNVLIISICGVTIAVISKILQRILGYNARFINLSRQTFFILALLFFILGSINLTNYQHNEKQRIDQIIENGSPCDESSSCVQIKYFQAIYRDTSINILVAEVSKLLEYWDSLNLQVTMDYPTSIDQEREILMSRSFQDRFSWNTDFRRRELLQINSNNFSLEIKPVAIIEKFPGYLSANLHWILMSQSIASVFVEEPTIVQEFGRKDYLILSQLRFHFLVKDATSYEYLLLINYLLFSLLFFWISVLDFKRYKKVQNELQTILNNFSNEKIESNNYQVPFILIRILFMLLGSVLSFTSAFLYSNLYEAKLNQDLLITGIGSFLMIHLTIVVVYLFSYFTLFKYRSK